MFKVVFNYMDARALNNVATLTAIWEKQRKDSIDLLIPFIYKSISESISEPMTKQSLDIDKISRKTEELFGYNTFPNNITQKIFNRLVKSGVLEKENRYFLIKPIKDEVKAFDEENYRAQAKIENVITSLEKYFNRQLNKTFTSEEIQSYLISFFDNFGIHIMDDPTYYHRLLKKDDPIHYYLGQFILNSQKENQTVFDDLVCVMQGFLISNVVFSQYNDESEITSNFNGTQVYLDTTFIIYLLGYKQREETKAADQAIQLLKECGASICCFEHNVDEVEGILKRYKKSLTDYKYIGNQTLEWFDENNISSSRVDDYITTLRIDINKLGIEIKQKPPIVENNNYNASALVIDRSSLEKSIKSNGKKYHDSSLENDLDSAEAIGIIRDDKQCNKIEDCTAIFMTTNSYLAYHVNKHTNLKIPLFITDINMVTYLWMKNKQTNVEYNKMKLIANASSAIEGTQELWQTILQHLAINRENQKISDEHFAAIKQDHIFRKDAAEFFEGDSGNVNTENTLELANRFKSKIKKSSSSEYEHKIEKLKEQNKKDKKKAEEEARQNLINEHCKTIDMEYDNKIKKAIGLVNPILKFLNIFSIIISFVITILNIFKLTDNLVMAIVSLAVAVITFLLNFKRAPSFLIKKMYDKRRDKKKSEFI